MRLLALLPLTLVAACSAPEMAASASYAFFKPDGDIGLASAGTPVVDTNLSALGIDEREDALSPQFDFKWGVPHLSVDMQSASWEGSGTLAVDFGDISAGETVSSELDLSVYRAYLTFDLAPTDVLELGIGFGALVLDLDVAVRPDSGSVGTQDFDELFPLPVVAARAGGRLWMLDLEAVAAGGHVDYDGEEATFLDLDLNAKYALWGSHGSFHGALMVGWRTTSFEVAYEDDFDNVDLDASFSGPYVGLHFGF